MSRENPSGLGWVAELPLGDWPAMSVRADDRPWPRRGDPDVLELRRRVLAEHPECVGAIPGAEPFVAEVAPDGLDAVALGQPDDVCLLAPEPGWPLVAGAVLFPSHWRLADKLGRALADVHGPVPGYAGDLAGRVERFLDKLRPGNAAWRRNVLLHRSGALHSPEPVDGGRWWLRSERQTFRRLPRTGAVLFTIAVDTAPLDDLVPEDRDRVVAWFRARPATWSAYAGLGSRLP